MVIYACQATGMSLPGWINNYVNDFLCLPIVLYIAQSGVRYLRNDERVRIPLTLVFFMALLYSVYFEGYLPRDNPRYTSDWIDIALYFSGAGVFYLLNRPSTPSFDS